MLKPVAASIVIYIIVSAIAGMYLCEVRHAIRTQELCGARIEYWFVPDGGHASTIGKHPAEFARRVLQFFSS